MSTSISPSRVATSQPFSPTIHTASCGASSTSGAGQATSTAKFVTGPNAAVFTEDGVRVEPGSGVRGLVAFGAHGLFPDVLTLLLMGLATAVLGACGPYLIGQAVDGRIFKPKGREGPRLQDLKVQTSSYGEERPADPEHNEGAWAKNRRAEFAFYQK